MADQISIEDALPVFRQRCGELADENLLLRSKVAGMERQLSQLEAEKSELMKALEAVTAGAAPETSVTSEC
ncbi:hypothetical protein [Streptomyces sp. NPDC051997]|uniref:hypothetical protein n=1 Tax=Streptomyces sp. NPDC051997 TaxID=3155611 RepID=UPI003441D013